MEQWLLVHMEEVCFYSSGFTSTAPLNAAFSPDKTSGVFPFTVNLMIDQQEMYQTWSWDFGDGNSVALKIPSTYTNTQQFFNLINSFKMDPLISQLQKLI